MIVEDFDNQCAERAVSQDELPPDPEGRNEDRSQTALDALRTLVTSTGADTEDALSDLLCNLMHFADRYDFDFESELGRAEMHYRAETSRKRA